MRKFLIALTKDPISLFGTAIATASATLFLILFAVEIVGSAEHPYLGILTFLILPAIFFFGLVLIPIGIIRHRRRRRRARERGEPQQESRFPVIDLNVDKTRRAIILFVVLTLGNVIILSTATFKGVEVMESTEFCGTTCHEVMIPEHTAYINSPHARVKCVECHIGPGANWFVKSKLSGAWQVVSVAFDLYPRPIPTPIHNLRPARETCEQCHWPTKFVGDRLKVKTHFGNDEANTEMKTVLLLRVGGIEGRNSHGIHWHVDPGNRIRYRSSANRETIYDVELTRPDGSVQTFVSAEQPEESESEEEEGAGEWRLMDCVDCHNRPTHIYRATDDAVDGAIQRGEIDRDLPYVRREGLRAVRAEYASHDEARAGITASLSDFYRENYPEIAAGRADRILAAGESLGDLYSRNVFPTMKVTWGTYPNHIGHENYPGCFRCHNDEHTSADGEVISQDCDTCHSLLALEEEDPAILTELNP